MNISVIAKRVDRHLERLLKLKKLAKDAVLLAKVEWRIEKLSQQWEEFLTVR